MYFYPVSAKNPKLFAVCPKYIEESKAVFFSPQPKTKVFDPPTILIVTVVVAFLTTGYEEMTDEYV